MSISSPLRAVRAESRGPADRRTTLLLSAMAGGAFLGSLLLLAHLLSATSQPQRGSALQVAPPRPVPNEMTASPTPAASSTPVPAAATQAPRVPETTVEDCVWHALPAGGTQQICTRTH